MTQIRAERKNYDNKCQQIFPFSHRDDTSNMGKKVFKEILYKTTLSPNKV